LGPAGLSDRFWRKADIGLTGPNDRFRPKAVIRVPSPAAPSFIALAGNRASRPPLRSKPIPLKTLDDFPA